MFLNNSSRQQRTLIQIAHMAYSYQLVQITQTGFILRQNNYVIALNFRRTSFFRSISWLPIHIIFKTTVADKVALHAENQL
ncbi:hypothetical protein EVA_09666 [gut metagenome]|uniref:Uncharacterized protein n=1 Tax=gut metagenome TaxID=749906 RepID=J9G4T5_9ZZZZ